VLRGRFAVPCIASSVSVIVNDFDFAGVAAFKAKTYAPLVVNPHAVLTCPVAAQKLQPVARRHAQKVQCRRGLKLLQLSHGNFLDVGKTGNPVSLQ